MGSDFLGPVRHRVNTVSTLPADPGEEYRAALLAADHARDADDLRGLLQTMGLWNRREQILYFGKPKAVTA